jgi:hypothetical protein
VKGEKIEGASLSESGVADLRHRKPARGPNQGRGVADELGMAFIEEAIDDTDT